MFLSRGEYGIWNLPIKKIAQDDGMKVLFFFTSWGPGGDVEHVGHWDSSSYNFQIQVTKCHEKTYDQRT